ncbi:TAXI family TRAP transporter solute-binding subunit [Rhodovulum sp. DZ06]|uniref:TAXI family TRAP transporter solute-binding subunit n=1 Tax=Rhodovulum sp. DZ06 TaxID=3425126 RepID=UPI003D32CBF1
MSFARILLGVTTAVSLSGAAATMSGAAELPRQLTWTAYGTGSAGYNQSVAIGAALKEALGVNLRVLPGKNDVSRTQPVRLGKVPFSANGVGGSYMAQEGVFDFSAEAWGPQPVRVIIANGGGAVGLSVGVAGDIGVENYSDLKGKRVAFVKGSPALNVNVEAYLAYGGLTWDDVTVVEFGGFGDSWTGLKNGQVDAAFASTNSGRAYEAATGPRGLTWPPIDGNDAEGMARMKSVAPFFSAATVSVGANIDGGPGLPTATYAYPVLMTMEGNADADLAYAMTKAMVELFDQYKGKAPGINGWALDNQDFTWVAPYHEGAIRYYKEIGVWSDEAQAHNDNLIARQAALMAAWEELKAEGPDDWAAAWKAKRYEALEAGGFEKTF